MSAAASTFLQPTPPPPTSSTSPPATPPSDPDARSPLFDRRSRRQFSYLLLGASAIWLSGMVTRRAIIKRHLSTAVKYFRPSNQPHEVQGTNDAVAALGIATMYVGSVGFTFFSGLLWALDLSSIEEMRYKFRKHAGIPLDYDSPAKAVGADGKDEVEREVEEWIADVLARKGLRLFGGKDLLDKVRAEFEREKQERREVEGRGVEKIDGGRADAGEQLPATATK